MLVKGQMLEGNCMLERGAITRQKIEYPTGRTQVCKKNKKRTVARGDLIALDEGGYRDRNHMEREWEDTS